MTDSERDDISNLMLLCQKHHKMIDDDPNRFSEDLLKARKLLVEESISSFVKTLSPSLTIVVKLMIPICGVQSAVSDAEMNEALINEGLFYDGSKPFDFSEGAPVASDLRELAKALDRRARLFDNLYDDASRPVSVFALAPQPLLVKLGCILGSTRQSVLFRPNRRGAGWTWAKDGATAKFTGGLRRDGSEDSTRAAVILNLSGTINPDTILDLDEAIPVYEFTTPSPDIALVDSRSTIDSFRKEATTLIDGIHERFPNVSELHFYPCMPAPLAVALGTVLRFNLIGSYVVHEKRDGVFGGERLLITRRQDD